MAPVDPSRREPLDPVLDGAPLAYVVLDDEAMVGTVNATFTNLTGWAPDEVLGRHVDTILGPAGRIFYSTHLFPLLRIEGKAMELYVPIRHRDGSDVPMLVNGRRRQADDGPRYDLFLAPMLQRNRLEADLIEARNVAVAATETKDQFVAVVSHELRSPLSAVRGYADLLLRERRGPLNDEQRRYVERIRNGADQLAELITDILDLAAVGRERELVLEPLRVDDALDAVEATLAVRLAQEGQTLRRSPTDARVMGDARAVQQILLNLGTNAMKYGAPGTPFELTVEEGGGRVRITVIDRGPGIAAEHLESIFQPFVQVGRTEAGGERGVGLGLSISRDLARAMGGDLVAASTQGVGSAFTLELPAA